MPKIKLRKFTDPGYALPSIPPPDSRGEVKLKKPIEVKGITIPKGTKVRLRKDGSVDYRSIRKFLAPDSWNTYGLHEANHQKKEEKKERVLNQLRTEESYLTRYGTTDPNRVEEIQEWEKWNEHRRWLPRDEEEEDDYAQPFENPVYHLERIALFMLDDPKEQAKIWTNLAQYSAKKPVNKKEEEKEDHEEFIKQLYEKEKKKELDLKAQDVTDASYTEYSEDEEEDTSAEEEPDDDDNRTD